MRIVLTTDSTQRPPDFFFDVAFDTDFLPGRRVRTTVIVT
jgi:hypothetical protein